MLKKKDEPITVVRSTPHRDDHPVEHQFVSLHGELMRARDEVDSICMSKGLDNVRAKQVASSTWGEAPAFDVYERLQGEKDETW